MPPTHLTGLSVHSSTPAVLSTSLSHSLFLRKTWSPCYQVLSLFYSMQRQIQMQTRMQILMHKNKYKYKGIYKCWTQIASPKSACCQVLSLVSSACWSCWHLQQICTQTQKFTNTHGQTYKCKDRDKTTHTEIQMQRQIYVFSHLAAKYSVMCPAQCWGLADISPEEKAPILKFSETFALIFRT